MNSGMNATMDRARLAALQLGWPGIAGLVLLVASLAGLFVVVPQRESEAAAARKEADQRHAEYQSLLQGGVAPQGTAETLARFHGSLMPEREADAAMESLQQLAQKHGLATAGTEYKWQRQPGARLAEVRIALPVKAGYSAVHDFVRDALAEVPGLALDQFEVQREGIGTGSVDARLRFSLFLRVGP